MPFQKSIYYFLIKSYCLKNKESDKQGKSEGFDSCDRPNNLTQIGFKSLIFQPVWPWNFMDDLKNQLGTSSILLQALCIISKPSVNSNLSYSRETLNSGQNQRFFLSRVTLKFDGEPLLYNVKLCAPFQSHRWIQTGVTIRKCPIWVKIDAIFLALWPWNLTDDLENQLGTSPKQHQALCIILSYVNSNWSYSPETAKLGFDLCDLVLWPLTLTFCMDITFVIGNKFHDDTMMGT